MKQDILNLLNEELNKASKKKDVAFRNQDLTMKLVWLQVAEILKDIIKKVQDEC